MIQIFSSTDPPTIDKYIQVDFPLEGELITADME